MSLTYSRIPWVHVWVGVVVLQVVSFSCEARGFRSFRSGFRQNSFFRPRVSRFSPIPQSPQGFQGSGTPIQTGEPPLASGPIDHSAPGSSSSQVTNPLQGRSTIDPTLVPEQPVQQNLPTVTQRAPFGGRELIAPSPLDEGAYYEFAKRMKRENCRDLEGGHLVTVLPNSSLADPSSYVHNDGGYPTVEKFREATTALAKEGAAILDMVAELRREGLIPRYFLLDIRYGKVSGMPMHFSSLNPDHADMVIMAGNGITIQQMRTFLTDPATLRQFATSQRAQQRFAAEHARAQNPQRALHFRQQRYDCSLAVVPRPYSMNY